jgi:hypothetical protein
MSASPTAPASDFEAVTPHDSTDYTNNRIARGLYVGTSGNVVVVRSNGTAVTFTNVQDGTVLPIQHKRVNSTSTTATNMVALF